MVDYPDAATIALNPNIIISGMLLFISLLIDLFSLFAIIKFPFK